MKKPILSILLAAAALLAVPLLSGCNPDAGTTVISATSTSTVDANIKADLAKFQASVDKIGAGALADVESPAFLALAGDLTDTALSVAQDAAQGAPGTIPAIIAGVEGGANAIQYVKALPTVASSSSITSAIKTGAGVATVATKVAPAVSTLITLATAKAGVSKQGAIVQAVLNGLYALRSTTNAGISAVSACNPHLARTVAFISYVVRRQ